MTDCRDLVRPAAAAQRLPSGDFDTSLVSGDERGRRVAAFASGGVLVVGAVAALHNLYRSGDGAAELISWSGLLLLALTALGGGIKFAMWGARPVIAALFDRGEERLTEPVVAVVASGAVIVGALCMWWTLRGGYAGWWQQVSGESQWSLSLGVGQMLVAVLAGAALFTGGRYVTGLAREALTESGLLIERDRAAGRRRVPEGLWHPGLVAALVGGGLALVVMTAWLTPKVGPTIVGANTLAAVAAIVAVLVWGVGANLGWWKGLAGLWKWATDASHKAAATSGVVALLMFSAGGLGLGWFTPATVPQAHAQCPPDCGGGSNGSGSYGPDASQFQPPQMPGQMPDYQGGINQPALDQNGSISIYNTQAPSVSNNGVQGSSGQQGPQQGWDQPAHGTQIPDYQNAAPYTQGPGRPNPDFNPGSDAGSQGGQPNQGAQQPVQQPQQASQQPTQQDAGQQPNQSPDQSSDQQKIDDLTRQLQEKQQQSSQDRQRIDDLTKQLQQQGQQRQNGNQKLPKAPSKDKKQDDKDQQDRDDQSGDNDLSALLLGAASTRRRKQDEQDSSDQQQPQGPDTQALAQDGAQLGQSLPGDIANTVSDSVNLGQSAGSAAQNFGSAAQAGASLASSAQSGAVNPMDAVALVQGVSGGISDTADAVGSGASIASTWLNNAGQGAQLAADANPQLKAEAEQAQQLTQAGGQVADLTGKVAGGVSQVSGMVNTASSLGTSGMPDTSDVGDATDALSGTATAVNGPGDVPKPTPPTPSQPSSASQLLGNMVGGPQQPTQPAAPGNPNAGSLQGILQPSPSADAVQKQLDLVNQAQDRVKQAQSVVDQSAAQVYMSPQNAPGPDDVKRQGQALFDARRELTDQTLALTEMNQRLIDNGQPPIQIPLLPDNVSRQAFPPEPSKAQEFSGAWSEFSKSTYGIVPDIPTDIRTATNFDQASGADKAALALDGMAIVPGLGAIGRGLKGIEGIRGGEAAIRGGEAAIRAADDIPLPSKPVGTSVVTDITKQGGQAVYQGLDNLGRPTGITARITPDMIGTGAKAGKAKPPGWVDNSGFARGHLFARQLGGGKESENIVTLIQRPVNAPVMSGFEGAVRTAVEGTKDVPGQIVNYTVTPLYKGSELMPAAVQIIAKGEDGFNLAVTILNR
ncbi:DNA/RNA non-specific endonuclease [Mycobacteroides abscessus]|uniref:DNA/RNA non-specific endonuclease n=1 Tax=Mycobacteroides abscessus TaxID=36809 RepID=UPI0009416530|nr:DNA/RNA non-specific endonuclease [Mycobacteroides abscessus]